ncbi:TnpV protein [bacterium D16-51]|nr:TnpV protein [bacterium D16-59]RKI58763.1 TnpV protein [bacterium D16-51]
MIMRNDILSMDIMDMGDNLKNTNEKQRYQVQEKVEIHQGLKQMLQKRPRWARQIVEFLQEKYPEQIPILLMSGEMEKLLDSRVEEARELYLTLHPKMQKKENIKEMEMMERICTEESIGHTIQEIIETTILFRPLHF